MGSLDFLFILLYRRLFIESSIPTSFFFSYKRVIHLPTGPSYHGSVGLIYIFNIGLGFLALLCLHATHYIILIYIYHGSVLEWLYSLLALLFYIDPIILHASMGFDLV